MPPPVQLTYEGLPELARALKETDLALLGELRKDLAEVGDVVRDDARSRLEPYDAHSAAGLETRVRAGGGASAIVVVAQSLRKVTGRRPDWGALQMTHALLPARTAKLDEAAQVLEDGAYRLLKEHGF